MADSKFQKIIRRPFIMGAFMHTILWLFIVNLDQTFFNFLCFETSCYSLIVIDIPFSIFYLGGNHVDVSIGSLFTGAVWWGFIFLGFSKLIGLAKKRDEA